MPACFITGSADRRLLADCLSEGLLSCLHVLYRRGREDIKGLPKIFSFFRQNDRISTQYFRFTILPRGFRRPAVSS